MGFVVTKGWFPAVMFMFNRWFLVMFVIVNWVFLKSWRKTTILRGDQKKELYRRGEQKKSREGRGGDIRGVEGGGDQYTTQSNVQSYPFLLIRLQIGKMQYIQWGLKWVRLCKNIVTSYTYNVQYVRTCQHCYTIRIVVLFLQLAMLMQICVSLPTVSVLQVVSPFSHVVI